MSCVQWQESETGTLAQAECLYNEKGAPSAVDAQSITGGCGGSVGSAEGDGVGIVGGVGGVGVGVRGGGGGRWCWG